MGNQEEQSSAFFILWFGRMIDCQVCFCVMSSMWSCPPSVLSISLIPKALGSGDLSLGGCIDMVERAKKKASGGWGFHLCPLSFLASRLGKWLSLSPLFCLSLGTCHSQLWMHKNLLMLAVLCLNSTSPVCVCLFLFSPSSDVQNKPRLYSKSTGRAEWCVLCRKVPGSPGSRRLP